jgi:ABC-type uncharacterized transport system ATPase subunit
MIEIRGLSKRYGDRIAVDDVSFTIRPGHVTGFLRHHLAPSRVPLEEAFMELAADSVEYQAKG